MTNKFNDGTMVDMLGRPVVSYSQLTDSSWITVHPNGQGTKGVPVRISENGTIEAGMGGKHNGKKLSELGKKNLTGSSSGTNIESEGNNKPTGVPKMKIHQMPENAFMYRSKNGKDYVEHVPGSFSIGDIVERIVKGGVRTRFGKPVKSPDEHNQITITGIGSEFENQEGEKRVRYYGERKNTVLKDDQ